MRWLGLLLVLLVAACDMAPRYVSNHAQIDGYLVRSNYRAACVALKPDHHGDDLRRYAAERLVRHPESPVASGCLCDALHQPGAFDAAVADALRGSARDDLATCLAAALDDPAVEDKQAVAGHLGRMTAPAGYEALARALASHPDAATRAAAAAALRGSEGHTEVLLTALAGDASAEVRAAAARAVAGRGGEAVVAALGRAAAEDAEGAVRAQAIAGAARQNTPESRAMVCQAMMDDPEASVREAAVRAFRSTRDPEAVRCLQRRLLAEERSGEVREATLEALRTSPADEAADALCQAIGPYLRLYVKDRIVDEIHAADIVDIQNKRDWDRSYACVERALAQGGYSCYARNYLGHWMNNLGGRAATPLCPGMGQRGG